MTDFYFNLEKNVAFGASAVESRKMEKHAEMKKPEKHVELQKPEKHEEKMNVNISGEGPSLITKNSHAEPSRTPEGLQAEASPDSKKGFEAIRETQVADASAEEKPEPSASDQPPPVHHKRSQDALAAAKERFLARKKAKEQ